MNYKRMMRVNKQLLIKPRILQKIRYLHLLTFRYMIQLYGEVIKRSEIIEEWNKFNDSKNLDKDDKSKSKLINDDIDKLGKNLCEI